MQVHDRRKSADKAEILGGLLRSWGHDADDFEVEEEQSSELADLFGLAGGVLVVRRRSTLEERLYATGFGSAWFGTLSMDLARGFFAPDRRMAGAGRDAAIVHAHPGLRRGDVRRQPTQVRFFPVRLAS
jgi:hypothetical protein